MKDKFEIIKTIDITEELVLIVAKKVKKEPKLCVKCPFAEHIKNSNLFYCNKYKGIIDDTDICIEEGM